MAGWLVVLPLLAEEPGRAVPLLDRDAVDPGDEYVPLEMEEPKIDPGIQLRDRVESASGQFGVSGGVGPQRSSLALEAESVRERFNRLIGEKSPDVTMPIEIILHGQPGDEPRARPLAFELRFTAETYLLRIHVDLARGLDNEKMERALLTGLLYQRALKGVKPGGLGSPLKAPVWLVEGLREAEKWRSGLGDRALYQGVFERGGHFTMDQLLGIDEAGFARLDGVSRTMFRVLSGALVMALLEQPRGQEAFAGFCDEIARFEGEYPILMRRHFPELNLSERSLVKWWALTLAKLADAPITDSMGIAESEKALAAALTLRYEDGEGLARTASFESLENLPDLDEAERFMVIRPAQEALNRLSYRCFPSYRPLLFEYQELLVSWADKGAKGSTAEALADLAEMREIMASRALRARDYMDYVEISQANELSGSFDDYLELKKELEERPRVERDDPISGYLDRFDRVYDPRVGRK
ncbi:hypothetical protein HAHE_40520 [Haloferula helveola]|uniref:Uncharacterized protein n=1 Tax=Haloferula helveola TaxID=490095 RepID=A0ABN6HFD3_9BACT|nr:hypothetical protein HAHE_40520 [Haloferula helveola]